MIVRGHVLSSAAGMIEARIPAAVCGGAVRVTSRGRIIHGTIAGVRRGGALIAPHDAIDGLSFGDGVTFDEVSARLPFGLCALGRAFDAQLTPLDGDNPVCGKRRPVTLAAPAPRDRRAVDEPLWTGIRAIDGLLTIGCGARVGIFGGPATGKSTLLHAVVRGSSADAVVIALIGERGREAEEWLRIAPKHSTVVCATSDRSASERARAAHVALAHAAILRECGLHVLFVLDSFARYGTALREIAIAAGEAPDRGGFPPRVFSELARFTEVAGATVRGSITMVASVLNDGDDRDPLSEAARALLDGHVQLSRSLADAGRFPAIDIPMSASRTMENVVSSDHRANAAAVRSALAALASTEDARSLGIQIHEATVMRAVAQQSSIEAFFRQDCAAQPSARMLAELAEIAAALRENE